MAKIYYDIYLIDKYADVTYQFKMQSDTLLVYEAIFNDYGYTSADYMKSTDYYLTNPEAFVKILKRTRTMLENRQAYLKEQVALEEWRYEEMHRKWPLLDTLDFESSPDRVGNEYFRAVKTLFFKADSIVLASSPVVDSSLFEIVREVFFVYDSLPRYSGRIVFPTTNFYRDTTSSVAIDSTQLNIDSTYTALDSTLQNSDSTLTALDSTLIRVDSLNIGIDSLNNNNQAEENEQL